MNEKYKLIKPLPRAKVGDLFHFSPKGNLVHDDSGVAFYTKGELKKHPEILQEWFEEVPDKPKTVYDLSEGDECYAIEISYYGPVAHKRHWSIALQHIRNLGLLTVTKEECEKKISWLLAKEILLRDTKGFKPTYKQQGVCIFWNHDKRSLSLSDCLFFDGTLRFANHEDAEASIKAHEKEWKTYLGVEE